MIKIWYLLFGALMVVKADPESVYNSLYLTSDHELTEVPLEVHGQLPSYLRGRIIHNGCGGFDMGEHTFSHVFVSFSGLDGPLWEENRD